MESLFLPRRTLSSCELPATVHVCCGVVEGRMSEEEAVERALRVVEKHALLRARVAGDGAPLKRGPLGAPLADSDLKHVLTPFGDDNMRIGRPLNPLRFEAMDLDARAIVDAAMESTTEEEDEDDWRKGFAAALDGAHPTLLFGSPSNNDDSRSFFDFDTKTGPLWRFKVYRSRETTSVVFGFDHAISDQPSAMSLLEDFFSSSASLSAPEVSWPPSLEEAILDGENGGRSRGFVSEDTGGTGLLALDKGSAKYLLSKAWSERDCVAPLSPIFSLPFSAARDRKTRLAWRDLGSVEALRQRAREENTSIGGALAAASALAFAKEAELTDKQQLKVLQSLDMRRFATSSDIISKDFLACHAGSMDLVLPAGGSFWDRARLASKQLKSFLDAGFGVDSVRVFDWATDAMEMSRLVELEADNPNTAGRAYACGISNAGVFESDNLKEVYYATSTKFAGAAFQAYALTLDGTLRASFSTVVADQETLEQYADTFQGALNESLLVLGNPRIKLFPTTTPTENSRRLATVPVSSSPFYTNAFVAALVGSLVGCGAHLDAWSAFFGGVSRAVDGVDGNLGELVAPFGFWLFFAVMHPLIGGAGVALGELAWQFPGYVPNGDLDAVGAPLAFSVLLLAATAALLATPLSRALSAFFATLWFSASITAGVAGTTPDVASYNLALDDAPFPATTTKVVRGCPAYADVADPGVENIFDARKYQGTWYEHAYHDWTQFSEVYDTSLDISLPEDAKSWVDIFKVKGPSPAKAPHSWRGSPVANGAAYPLYGTLSDPKQPSLGEKGFGNVFPNYVIDLQTDPKTGEYTEAIQFQCLEAGGVRVFEGINFLSRRPDINQKTLDAMFQRAEKIAPYGATPEQMHIIEHNVPPMAPVDNWWQRAWTFVGLPALLELIAKDI